MSYKRHRSFSQLKKVARCGELYRLDYTTDLPKGPSAAMALGSAFHGCYEEWELGGRGWPLVERFIGHYELQLERCWLDQPDVAKWTMAPRVKEVATDIKIRQENGLLMCESYEEHCRQSPWEIYRLPDGIGRGEGVSSGKPAIELNWEVDLGEFTVRGAIDTLLEWPSGNLTPRDLKTGIRENSGLQLGVYAWALRKVYNIHVDFGEFYYTKDGANHEYDLSRYTDEYVEELLISADQIITERTFLVNPGSHCTMCSAKNYCRELGDLYDVPNTIR